MTTADLFTLVLHTLAVWRVSHLVSEEMGPFDSMYKLRKAMGVGFFGSLLSCFYCTSMWVAWVLALYQSDGLIQVAIYTLALSGFACIIFKFSEKNVESKAPYFEEPE